MSLLCYRLQYLPDGSIQHPVASSEALDLLHWAIHTVLYRCTAAAIEMASKVGQFFVVVSFAVALVAAGAIWSK
jgi:hypothetical protein